MPEAGGIESTYEIPVLGETPKPEAPAAPKAAESPDPKADAQDTEDQATSAKPEGEKPEVPVVTPEQAAKREGRRFERKLDKAFRERAEAQARADFLDRQLAEERAKSAPKAPDGKPTLESCDFDPEKYAQESAKYATTQAGKELEAKQRSEAGKQYQQSLISGWEEKVDRAAEKYEDFQEKVGNLKPDSHLHAAIMEAPNGDDIAYHLGSNPKEAERIALIRNPRLQAFELGLLSAKLSAEPVKPKTPSSAPEPIKPVGGSSSPSTKKLTEMNQDEFEKRRRAQVAARR